VNKGFIYALEGKQRDWETSIYDTARGGIRISRKTTKLGKYHREKNRHGHGGIKKREMWGDKIEK